ncbi:unnamed protein product [Phytophthora lilii]|uniref:Unnamed protein product n=1 Tax=Phytophthora lilii TaxID=2077276 RepID=A0A9W6XEC1_9STRA|nr:unnamed protein product [Phytophthora lilii]
MRPSSSNYEIDVATIGTDSDTECISSCSSQTKDHKLPHLSRAEAAVALNSINRVRMCKAHDEDKRVTVYVLDVLLQVTLKGIPKATHQSKANDRSPSYQVKHRYSAFRALRQCIGNAVVVPKDKSHSKWCPYCSRVRELVKSSLFPSRFPNQGPVATVTGWHDYLARSRAEPLEAFVNRLLHAAKDISYRSGCIPCDRFEAVSRLLIDFLSETA